MSGRAAYPRTCDYCQQPATGVTGRVVPGDKTSALCAFGPGHEGCRVEHHDAIYLHNAGDLQAGADLTTAADQLRERGHR